MNAYIICLSNMCGGWFEIGMQALWCKKMLYCTNIFTQFQNTQM